MCYICVVLMVVYRLVVRAFVFFNETATTESYTLSLHDALPISHHFTLTMACHGGIFSVALSLGLPPPGVTRHPDPVEPGLSSPPSLANWGSSHPTI